MRGPELIAQTESPASHRIFIAVPPPAPVPTTIASKSFVGMSFVPLLRRTARALRCVGFMQVNVFGIIRMRTSRHRRPNQTQTGITQALEPNPRRVVANHGVVPHQLKKLSSAFRRQFE